MYPKAKSARTPRFWGIVVPVAKPDTLAAASQQAKRNGGAPGLDGQPFADIEAAGRDHFLAASREELLAGPSHPHPPRVVESPKGDDQVRQLQLPCRRDRVVPGALKLILEAIFEADCGPNPYGYRPQRSPHQALAGVRRRLRRRRSTVIEVELARYFD
jgi:retron-type reverse transcriptase